MSILKRAHSESLSPKVWGRKEAAEALREAQKLSSYLETVGARFSDVRDVHDAGKKIKAFLATNRDLLPHSVESAIQEIKSLNRRLASNEFDYEAMVDEASPNSFMDVPVDEIGEEEKDSDVISELGGDEIPVASTPKTAGSELLEGDKGVAKTTETGKARWENFSNEALTEMIKTLTSTDGFGTDSESQKSVAEMAEVLAARPIEVPAEDEPKTAKKRSALKGLRLAGVEAPKDITHADDTDPRWNLEKDSIKEGLKESSSEEEDGIVESKTAASGDPYGVRWSEFDRSDQIVHKQKDFKTEAARTKYTDVLEKKDNFKCFDSWSDPTPIVSKTEDVTGKKASKKAAASIPFKDTEIHTWFERDNKQVELRNKKTQETILDWNDEGVDEMVEDGFLDPKDWHRSAYEYAETMGVLSEDNTEEYEEGGADPDSHEASIEWPGAVETNTASSEKPEPKTGTEEIGWYVVKNNVVGDGPFDNKKEAEESLKGWFDEGDRTGGYRILYGLTSDKGYFSPKPEPKTGAAVKTAIPSPHAEDIGFFRKFETLWAKMDASIGAAPDPDTSYAKLMELLEFNFGEEVAKIIDMHWSADKLHYYQNTLAVKSLIDNYNEILSAITNFYPNNSKTSSCGGCADCTCEKPFPKSAASGDPMEGEKNIKIKFYTYDSPRPEEMYEPNRQEALKKVQSLQEDPSVKEIELFILWGDQWSTTNLWKRYKPEEEWDEQVAKEMYRTSSKGRVASDKDDKSNLKSAEKDIEKVIKFIDELDVQPILQANGSAAVVGMRDALATLKERAVNALKDTEKLLGSAESSEAQIEAKKDKMTSKANERTNTGRGSNMKSLSLRGLRLADVE